MLESRERDEIERILSELSEEAGSFADTIKISCESAAELNLIFSKAQLAYKMKATMPIINSRGVIELKKARHPLLDPKKAVPIDVSLGDKYDSLVITGPNTGGKTVSIKTIGLLTLMAECGLFIPANENSSIAVFKNVFADIGEEQSIEQSQSGIIERAIERTPSVCLRLFSKPFTANSPLIEYPGPPIPVPSGQPP